MAPKSKKGRGKTLNITEFNEDYIPDDAYDWAEEEWIPDEQAQSNKLAEKIQKQHREYSRTAKNTLGEQESFRTATALQPEKQVSIDDLQPPFVAHFGNLRNGTKEEDFLKLFSTDSIVTHRLINQDGKSFAFVEFNSRQALAIALMLDGTFQRGRKMYADLATQKQVERLFNKNDRGPFTREGAGQPQHSGLTNMDISRDVFGGHQPELEFGLGGGRSGFGSRQDLANIGPLSRDLLGSAVQNSSPVSSPMMSSPANLSNWRNEGAAPQPEFNALRENRRSDDTLDRRGGFWGEKAQAPQTSASPLANWRDEPRAEARQEGTGGRGGTWGGFRNSGGRGAGPERPRSPKQAATQDAEKWSNLRRPSDRTENKEGDAS